MTSTKVPIDPGDGSIYSSFASLKSFSAFCEALCTGNCSELKKFFSRFDQRSLSPEARHFVTTVNTLIKRAESGDCDIRERMMAVETSKARGEVFIDRGTAPLAALLQPEEGIAGEGLSDPADKTLLRIRKQVEAARRFNRSTARAQQPSMPVRAVEFA